MGLESSSVNFELVSALCARMLNSFAYSYETFLKRETKCVVISNGT